MTLDSIVALRAGMSNAIEGSPQDCAPFYISCRKFRILKAVASVHGAAYTLYPFQPTAWQPLSSCSLTPYVL